MCALYISGVRRNFKELKPVLKSSEHEVGYFNKYVKYLQWFLIDNPQQKKTKKTSEIWRRVGKGLILKDVIFLGFL